MDPQDPEDFRNTEAQSCFLSLHKCGVCVCVTRVGRSETETSLFGSIPMLGFCFPTLGKRRGLQGPPWRLLSKEIACWVTLAPGLSIPTLIKGHTALLGID